MVETQVASVDREFHIEIIDGATYEVISRYIGDISFIALLKKMLKRDFEKSESR